MKLLGIVFILSATGWMSLGIARSYRTRIGELRSLLQDLQLMRNEIAFCGTPLPGVFAALAERETGILARLFEGLAAGMEEDRTRSPAEALNRLEPCSPVLWPVLESLCEKLGSYDLEAQLAGLAQVRGEAELRLAALERQQAQKGRAYESLGICAGLALAILLI